MVGLEDDFPFGMVLFFFRGYVQIPRSISSLIFINSQLGSILGFRFDFLASYLGELHHVISRTVASIYLKYSCVPWSIHPTAMCLFQHVTTVTYRKKTHNVLSNCQLPNQFGFGFAIAEFGAAKGSTVFFCE